MVPEVGEKGVLHKFPLDFPITGAVGGMDQAPETLKGLRSGSWSVHTLAVFADKSARFGMEVGCRFRKQAFAAAADAQIQVITPHFADVQKPSAENVGGSAQFLGEAVQSFEYLCQLGEFFLKGNSLGSVSQDDFRHHLGLGLAKQVCPHVSEPVDEGPFLHELQVGVWILAKDNFAQGQRVQGSPERGFLSLASLKDEAYNA